jgi:hypothetical protein
MADPDLPKIAPYRSCVSCLKGDTSTAVQTEGEAEWCAAALSHFAGIDTETATTMVEMHAEEELGCEPGMVPAGRIAFTFRLCRDCARRTGVDVTELGERGRVYAQP